MSRYVVKTKIVYTDDQTEFYRFCKNKMFDNLFSEYYFSQKILVLKDEISQQSRIVWHSFESENFYSDIQYKFNLLDDFTTQKISITPIKDLPTANPFNRIAELMPHEVSRHLESTMLNGTRYSQISAIDNNFNIETAWLDKKAKEQYKALMVDVSPTVKSTMANEGWLMVFTPETIDL